MGGTVDFLWKGYYQSVFLNTIFSFKKSDFQAFPVGGILGKQNDLAWFYCMVIQKSPCSYVFFAYIQIVWLRLIFRLQSYAIRFSACGCGAVCKWPEIFAETRQKSGLGCRFFSKRLPCESKDEKTKCTSGNVSGLRGQENTRSMGGKCLS